MSESWEYLLVVGEVVRVDHVDRLELKEARNVEHYGQRYDGSDGGADAVQRAGGRSDPAAVASRSGQHSDRHVPPAGDERRQPDGRHLTDKQQRSQHHPHPRPPLRLEGLVDADELKQRRQGQRFKPGGQQEAVGQRQTAQQEGGGRRQRDVEAERGERQAVADDAGDADRSCDRHVRVEPRDRAAAAVRRQIHHRRWRRSCSCSDVGEIVDRVNVAVQDVIIHHVDTLSSVCDALQEEPTQFKYDRPHGVNYAASEAHLTKRQPHFYQAY